VSLNSTAVDSTLSTVLPATVDGSLAATSSVFNSSRTDRLYGPSVAVSPALAVSASLAMGVAKNEYWGDLSPPSAVFPAYQIAFSRVLTAMSDTVCEIFGVELSDAC